MERRGKKHRERERERETEEFRTRQFSVRLLAGIAISPSL